MPRELAVPDDSGRNAVDGQGALPRQPVRQLAEFPFGAVTAAPCFIDQTTHGHLALCPRDEGNRGTAGRGGLAIDLDNRIGKQVGRGLAERFFEERLEFGMATKRDYAAPLIR